MRCSAKALCVFSLLLSIAQASNSQPDCAEFPLLLSSRLFHKDQHFTASSSRYKDPSKTNSKVLNERYSETGWAPQSNNNPKDYLQIDLGSLYKICAISTKGHRTPQGGVEYTTRYKLLFSQDNVNWKTYKDKSGSEIFRGNSQAHVAVKNTLDEPVVAKFIRVIPTDSHGHKALRVEVYGQQTACGKAFGIEDEYISDNSITATHDTQLAHKARLYGKEAWCSSQNSFDEFIQVDFGVVRTVTGIATQGFRTSWVSSYQIHYSVANTTWHDYRESKDATQAHTFSGNTDGKSVRVHWFKHPVTARYFRVNPSAWEKAICLRIELYGCPETSCDRNPLGLSDRTIPNSHVTSSSFRNKETVARNGRLGYTARHAWCAADHDSDDEPWLQVDLGVNHVICAIATQGNSKADEWVTSYHVMHSRDGVNWKDYKPRDHAQQKMLFPGNFDQSSVVKNRLDEGIVSRYFRVLPQEFYGSVCMRLELYGRTQSDCQEIPSGIKWSGASVPDHKMVATTFYSTIGSYPANFARLHGPSAWAPTTGHNANDYLVIDLGSPVILCGVATQGGVLSPQWTTLYKIRTSIDGRVWSSYSEDQTDKEVLFRGNSDQHSVIKHNLDRPFPVKYLRFYPVKFHNYKQLRVEVYGLPQETSYSNKILYVVWRSPLGVEHVMSRIANRRITTNSPHKTDASFATAVRLYSGSVWCAGARAAPKDPYYYIQIDLGSVALLTGVAMRGHSNSWLIAYDVISSIDLPDSSAGGHSCSNNTLLQNGWNVVAKNVTGNTNAYDIVVTWLKHPTEARYVRVIPRKVHNKPCFSLDLHGDFKNDTASPPQIVNLKETGRPTIKATKLECVAAAGPSAEFQWYLNGKLVDTKLTDMKYSKYPCTFSSVVFHYDSVDQLKSLGRCKFEGSGRDESFFCTLDYKCQVCYNNMVSGGASEKGHQVKIEIANKCLQKKRCHSNSTCVTTDMFPEGYYCKCDKSGHFASSGNQAQDRSLLLPGKGQYCRVNLASNKAASQKSSDNNKPSDANNALDVTKTSGDVNNHGCSLTTVTDHPWWMVDLGGTYNVKEVFLKRADCCAVTVQLHVGKSQDKGGSRNAQCGERSALRKDTYETFYCNPPLDGRYVSVHSTNKNVALALCGVEIYSDFKDFDECAANICPDKERMLCNNTVGSYLCYCDVGMTFDQVTKRCVDVDECMADSHRCDINAECINTVSSYTCRCKNGYHGDGYICHDINECQDGVADCGSDAKLQCLNTLGSFKCACEKGYLYQASSRVCTDINECGGTESCTKCKNTIGSYKCSVCADGYWRRGWICEDFDECKHGTYDCPKHMLCRNTMGSYECKCKRGYTKKAGQCVDVDECKKVKCPKNHKCENTKGSYKCVCKRGYNLVENEKERICVKAGKHSGQTRHVTSIAVSYVIVAMTTVMLTATAS